MDMLPKTAERIFAEQILTKALRVIKLSNPSAYSKLDQGDFNDVADMYEKEFMDKGSARGTKILEEALSDFQLLAMREPNVNLGAFNRVSYLAKSRADEYDRTQEIIRPHAVVDRKEKARTEIARIRELLKNAVKPLPYNQYERFDI